MGSKGGQTTTTNQSQTYMPSQQAYGAISGALGQAQTAAAAPFQQPVAPVAGFSPQQMQAFQQTGNIQGMAQPYINQASNYFGQSAQAPNISQFFNPFAGAVNANLQDIFGQQQSQTQGQLTQAAGGVGADRIAVGQAELAKQQGLAAGQTFAGLYQPSLQAAQQEQNILQGAGYGMGVLGPAAQNSALQGTQALLGTGGLQQQEQQAQMNAPYQNQLARLAYPFQTAQFNAGITGALAPGLGGTTTGTGSQTSPAPSIWSQILGGGAAAAGLYGQFGGFGGNGSPITGAQNVAMGQGQSQGYDANGNWVPGPTAAQGGRVNPYSTMQAFADGGELPLAESVPLQPLSPFEHYNVNVWRKPGDKVGPLPPVKPGEKFADGGSPTEQDILSQIGTIGPQQQGNMASDPYLRMMESQQLRGDAGSGSAPSDQLTTGVNDHPINASPASVVPNQQLAPIQPHIPQLNLNPSGGGGSGGGGGDSTGSDISSILKIGAAFAGLRRGGTVDPHKFDGANPYAFTRGGYAPGGAPDDDEPIDFSRVSPMSEMERHGKFVDPSQFLSPTPGMPTNAAPRAGSFFGPERSIMARGAEPPNAVGNMAFTGDPSFDQRAGHMFDPAKKGDMQRPTFEARMNGMIRPGDMAQVGAQGAGAAGGGGGGGGGGGWGSSPFTPPLPQPRPGAAVAQGNGVIDASDINIDADRSGMGKPWSPTNPALDADAGVKTASNGPAPSSGAGMKPTMIRDDSGQPGAQPASVPGGNSARDFMNSPWAALTAAGLGMMAGTSPFAGVNIGRGGLQGLQALQQQRTMSQKDTTIEQEARKLDLAAQKEQFEMTKPYPSGQVMDPSTGYPLTTYMRYDPTKGWVAVNPLGAGAGTGATPGETGAPVTPQHGLQLAGELPSLPGEASSSTNPHVHPETLQNNPNASIVKAIAEGRQSITSVPMRLRNKMERDVNNYDEDWDQNVFGARASLRRDFATGNSGKMLLSVNQLLPHIRVASDAMAALQNGNYPAFNQLANTLATQTGAAPPKTYEEVREVMSMDAARLLRGSGQMAEKDIEFWRNNLGGAGSPNALNNQFATLADDLIGARVGSLEHQWRTTMKSEPPELLSPEAKAALQTIKSRRPGATAPASGGTARAGVASGSSTTKVIGGKTYYQRDGKWFDTPE